MDRTNAYVAAAAAVISLAATRIASGQPAARMTVHLVDYARVTSNDLKEARREAAEIYAAAGIELVWVTGNEEDHPATTLDVRVQLLDGAMSNRKIDDAQLDRDALGIGSQGGPAYVFVNRVRQRSAVASACSTRILGRVIAHEIGHVVLPERSHTSTGIMQASVDMRPRGDRYFTQAQAATLLKTLAAGH